jgi:hypothetical protein
VGTNIFQIRMENYVRKKNLQMIRIHPLKRRRRKEVKKNPNSMANGSSNAQWCLKGSIVWWPLKGSNAWWPMEGSNVWWPMEREGEAPFDLFPFSPQQILLKPSFFPLILRFYFTLFLGCYLRISFLFFDL